MYYSNFDEYYSELRTIAKEMNEDLRLGIYPNHVGMPIMLKKMHDLTGGIFMSEVYDLLNDLTYVEVALDQYLDRFVPEFQLCPNHA